MARPRRANRRGFVLTLVVLTSITLITLDSRSGRTGPLGAVGRAAHTIVSPVERAVADVTRPIGDWWSGLVDSGKLKRENRSLRDRVSKLEGDEHQAAQALHENDVLRQLLGLKLLSSVPRVVARVVDRDPGNFESTVEIDRGTEAGIADGMAVLAPDGSVAGHVIAVWHGGATVRVLDDPDSSIAVRTIEHPVTGIAQGHLGSRELTVADFDPSATIKVGEEVVTSDIANSVYPPDLPVGTVTRVEVQPAGLGTVVHIDPFVDFGGLEFVAVLKWVPGEGPVVLPPTTTTTTTTTTTVPANGTFPPVTTTTVAVTTTTGH
jgi:rod shape-determining protein MreC